MDNGVRDEIDPTGVLETGRAIRPYLPALVGPAADALDRQIAALLAEAAGRPQAASELRALLQRDEVTADFLTEVLVDSPDYRPPDLQPGYVRTRGMQPLAGDVAPVLHSGKFVCPRGDYVWYRPASGTPLPACPTHGAGLIRA